MRWPIVLAVALAACGDNRAGARDAREPEPEPCWPVRGSTVFLRQVAQLETEPGARFPVLATSPPGDPRLFIVMRDGRILILVDEVLQPEPFIDLSSVVLTELTVERGLLGLAFHPRYATNGQFFVFYTTLLHSVVARCSASATDPGRANPTCLPILEALHDRAGNHNAGMLEFGSDGLLYISTGDGGGAGDPNRRSQDPGDLLGKILRIDVDRKAPGLEYGIPATNPYAGGGGRPEVFIRGLRNPWRFSFDRGTGDLWIGDVGQARFEEMNVLRPGQQAGANLGWSIYEGTGCCATQSDLCLQAPGASLPCDPTGMFFPQDARDRATPRGLEWASIITGQTYRGTCYPDLVGYHFYTDIAIKSLIKARLLDDDSLEMTEIPDVMTESGASSLHADSRGELYLTHIRGMIYHLEARP